MKISDEKKEIAKAMNALQKQMRPASKDSLNPHFKSKYASFESTWEALRDPLTDHGLSCSQEVTTNEKSVSVVTFVLHVSGEWIEFGPLTMPVTKIDCQGFASAISYSQRYALKAAFGIPSGEDDDGNAAAQPLKTAQNTQSVQKITNEQANHLRDLLAKCPKEFADSVLVSIRAEPMSCNSLSDIPSNKFDAIVAHLNKKLNEKGESNG